MDRDYFTSFVEKFYLNGLIERSKMDVSNKNIKVEFIGENKDLMGIIEAPNFELEDAEIGIYDTSKLVKFLSITDDFIELKLVRQNKISKKLLIADNKYDLEYVLADITLIPKVPVVEEPAYECILNIDKEFIDKFIKAKRALGNEIFSIDYEMKETKAIKFILGSGLEYTNKINFSIPCNQVGIPGINIKFSADYFKEILEINKDLSKGTLYLSEQGLMKLEFENKDNIKSKYFLVAKEN